MSDTIRIRAKRVPGFLPDQVVAVAADEHGTPLDQHWRRRLKDAERDGCCEVVKDAAPPVKSRRVRTRDEAEDNFPAEENER